MPKAHRAYKRTWWVPGFEKNGWADDIDNGTFGFIPFFEKPEERYVMPFVRYEGDGVLLSVPFIAPPEQVTRERKAQLRERGNERAGIPAGVDVQEWYDVYTKVKETLTPDARPLAQEEKRDYYRDIIINLYIASGHSVGDSIEIAYSPRGDELARYLSGDKRHALNSEHVAA